MPAFRRRDWTANLALSPRKQFLNGQLAFEDLLFIGLTFQRHVMQKNQSNGPLTGATLLAGGG